MQTSKPPLPSGGHLLLLFILPKFDLFSEVCKKPVLKEDKEVVGSCLPILQMFCSVLKLDIMDPRVH